MSNSSTFRGPIGHSTGGKAERLFRAAISAFCAITRPTRREVAQIDDLTLPLFSSVSDEALRYAAAALSEVPVPPPLLCRRLANESVEISAPLLIRCPVLSEIDLVMLIGRHGAPHARVIARRAVLDPAISDLIRAIAVHPEPTVESPDVTAAPDISAPIAAAPAPADPLEETRDRLRAMMRPAGQAGQTEGDPQAAPLPWPAPPHARDKLLATVVSGIPPLYQTALADLLALDMETARALTRAEGGDRLLVALRALDLSTESAFLIAACIGPAGFGRTSAIAAFLERYRGLDLETARAIMRGWRGDGAAAAHEATATDAVTLVAANGQAEIRRLMAS